MPLLIGLAGFKLKQKGEEKALPLTASALAYRLKIEYKAKVCC